MNLPSLGFAIRLFPATPGAAPLSYSYGLCQWRKIALGEQIEAAALDGRIMAPLPSTNSVQLVLLLRSL